METAFAELCSTTSRTYTLVLMHNGKSISEDMFQECQSAALALDKPLKLFVCKAIAKHYQQEEREDIIHYAYDKMGWEKFKLFMQEHSQEQHH